MFITVDILQKRGACQDGLDFFAKHYPDGVDMLYAINHLHLPTHFLHWGHEWLDYSQEEEEAYFKKVRVINSEGIHYSNDVENSSTVSNSEFIINSQYIISSRNIQNSEEIFNSDYVEDSKQVYYGYVVSGSHRILNSKNIIDSKEVVASNFIVSSNGVYKSDDISHSYGIWHCQELDECIFCFNCHNLKHSMFCQGIDEGEYMLFNKPIGKERYEVIFKQFVKMFQHKYDFTMLEDNNIYGTAPNYYRDYRKHMASFSDDLWEWVKTLPKYDPIVMYSITFNPLFIT